MEDGREGGGAEGVGGVGEKKGELDLSGEVTVQKTRQLQ